MPSAAAKALEIYPRNSFALALLRNADLQAGEYSRARARYAQAYPELLAAGAPKIDETNYGAAIDLALVLQKTGELERAALLLDGSEGFLRTIPRMGWLGYGIADAQIHALRGQKKEALAALREAENDGWRYLWRFHRDHDPNLAFVRDDPQFKAIFADIERDMAAQRARLGARPRNAPPDLAPAR
jgi:tetratricopeptide (TPR) repeat protein